MRITAQEKDATRKRILESAAGLFRARGFDATTTRDITQAAGIATGTLFNYFPSKELIVECLGREALAKARDTFTRRAESLGLEEDLFAMVAAELRELKPLRRFIAPLLETSLCPLSIGHAGAQDEPLRTEILESVAGVIRKHGLDEVSPIALHVYWSLYAGVLAFWTADKSPRQEDTLALLDESLSMFTAWLLRAAGEPVERR